MAAFEAFNFKSLDDLKRKVEELGIDIQFSDELSPLFSKVKVGTKETPNSFAVLPMEGCDSELDGSPSDLVRQRYRRYAVGGAGLIWWEACAVVQEGKANPHQMSITSSNIGSFAKLLEETKRISQENFGTSYRPVNILQLTHSGRYSRPFNKAAPLVP
ncbi:MAG: NADH:flavin oxidoreductase, partial [Rectinema sp.]